MRKSVEERLKKQTQPIPKPRSFFRSHRAFMITIASVLVLGISTLSTLYFYGEKTTADMHTRASDSAKKDKAMLAAVKKRVAEQKERERKAKAAAEAKKRAEEAARKKREAAEAAKRRTLAQQAPSATPSKPSGDCGGSGPHRDPNSFDVIVNKKHCLVPINFYPSDLVTTAGGATLRSVAATQFESLRAAAGRSGYAISASSSFRSYDNQVATYNYWVGVNGSYAAADRVSARPGYSEHQTGLTVDLTSSGCALDCFGGTGAYSWMKNHAAAYGFIERYPAGYESVTGYSAEPWHWRYVGPGVAQAFSASGVPTLEQYWGIPGGTY